MEEKFQYCRNCKRDINVKNYVIHTAHCERKIQLCNRCSEPVPRSELKEHEEEFHSKDICSDCGISMEKWQIEKHKETCNKKLVACEYCELEVPLDSLFEHITTCGSRTERCSKCNKHVMIKDLKKHPIDCLMRDQETMPCEYCGLPIDWNEIMEHTTLCGTRTERCFLCNEHVMVKDRDTHYVICEKSIDFEESISCDICGGSFTRNTIERHVELCRSHLEKCKKCDSYFKKELMELHLANCDQKQLKLQLPCIYCGDLLTSDIYEDHVNICGSRTQECRTCSKFILLKNMDAHSDTCLEKGHLKPQFPCNYCGELFHINLLEDHTDRCGFQTQKCEKCEKFIPLKNMAVHSNMCIGKKDLKLQYPCNYCGELFPSDFLKEHANRCGSRTQKCEKCGKFILMKILDAHSNMCLKEKQLSLNFPCRYCGELFPNSFLEVHTNRCGSETRKCKECEKFIPLKDMEAHSDICEKSSTTFINKIPCKYCKAPFPYNMLEHHVSLCSSQTEKCRKCETFIPHNEMDGHQCVNEQSSAAFGDKIPCKYCEISFPYNVLEQHVTLCRSRTEKCRKCEKFIPHNEMDGHQCVNEQSKSKTFGNCLICHQPIPWIEMNVHSAYCSQVYYDTPECELQNQFNELALRKESEDRVMTYKSSEEKKSQPFEGTKKCSFCSNIFPYRHFPEHLEVCLERPYNCDKCLKAMSYRKKEEHIHSCRGQQINYMLPDEETDDNKEVKKLKKCQYCDEKMTDVLFNHHLKICERREEKCTICSENVPVKNMQEHKLFQCNFAQLPGNRNIYSDNNAYAKDSPGSSENFEKRRHLEVKVELCPSCNSKIPEERYHEHLLMCYNEMTQCHFCGEEIPKKKEHLHLKSCDKLLAIAREDNKPQSSKKNEKKKKSLVGEILEKYNPFGNSNKNKASGRNSTTYNYQKPHHWQSNRGEPEKGYRPPVQPPRTKPNEVINEIPCEFCNELYPAELLIEHESGCRPDLMSFPKSNEGNENDEKLVTAAASASPISHVSGLGARPKYTKEENFEWKEMQYRDNSQASIRENFDYRSKSSKGGNTVWKEVESERSNHTSFGENTDYRKKERNVHQSLSNVKEKFFFYSSQDTDEVSENRPSNSAKKSHFQMREYPETSKVKPDKEFGTNYGIKKDESDGTNYGIKKDESDKDRFTAFKYSSSKFKEGSPNYSNFRKENDSMLSSDVKSKENETEKRNLNSFQTFSVESNSMIESSKPYINREIKAVGAERTEKKRIMQAKKDAEADLSLTNKDFEETSSQKPIISDESNKRETSKFPESTDSNILSMNLPVIWNTEYNSNYNKTSRRPLLKSLNGNYGNKTRDDTFSKAAENIDHKALDTNIQDTDYDTKNNETFGSDFLESIKNIQNKEDENETHSNSDDIFYDADDGGAKYFDNDNLHGNINPNEEKLSHYHLDNLNSSHKHQRDNVRQKSYENLEERRDGKESYEEDFNLKDSDLNGYIQFLRKSIKVSDKAIGNEMNRQEKLTSPLKIGSSSSESSDTEPFNTRVKTSNQMKSKKSPLKSSGKEKVKDESFASNETLKWKKWREPEVTDSD